MPLTCHDSGLIPVRRGAYISGRPPGDGGTVASYRYRITVRGGLGAASRNAFEGYIIESSGTETRLIQELDPGARPETVRVAPAGGRRVPPPDGRPPHSGGACLTSTSSRPSARTRSSRA